MRKVITAAAVVWLIIGGGTASAADHVDHLTPRQQWCDSVGVAASNDDGTTTGACKRAHSQCRADSPAAAQMNWASVAGETAYHDGQAWVLCPTPAASEDDSGDGSNDDAEQGSEDDSEEGSDNGSDGGS